MPVYEYRCPSFHSHDRIRSVTSCDEPSPCPVCGQTASRAPSLVARTSGRWGDTQYGINGFYDRGLGATYHNNVEREALMKAKGLITWDEAGGDEGFRQSKQKTLTANAKVDAYEQTFSEAVTDGAPLIKAHDLAKTAQETTSLTIDN